MHIQDGVLSPAVCAVTGAISLGAVGYSVHRLKQSVGDKTIPLTGMMAALVFAGQMVNFPIGAPVSGHLLGGVLAALVTESATKPATLQLGIVNRVVQKTFKVVSTTQTGAPVVVSTALVQVNDYGEFVVNSWQVATS